MSQAPHLIRYRIRPQDAGLAILSLLRARFPMRSAAEWTDWITRGLVALDGERTRPDMGVQTGQTLSCRLDEHTEPPADCRYDRLWVDDVVIAVAKPGALPCHRAGPYIQNTLMALLRRDFEGSLHLLGRLDREVSGIVVVARTKEALRGIGRVEKGYLGVVRGVAPRGRFDCRAPLRRASSGPPWNEVHPLGKASQTQFETVAVSAGHSLIRAWPLTGRPHQIRVHLQHVGLPLLGDGWYGVPGASRPLLHAELGRFCHPTTGQSISLRAVLPADMGARMEALGFDVDMRCGPA